jgi:hypothetical protein
MLCFKENICPLLVFGQWETNIILKNKDRLRRQDRNIKQHFEKKHENDKKHASNDEIYYSVRTGDPKLITMDLDETAYDSKRLYPRLR